MTSNSWGINYSQCGSKLFIIFSYCMNYHHTYTYKHTFTHLYKYTHIHTTHTTSEELGDLYDQTLCLQRYVKPLVQQSTHAHAHTQYVYVHIHHIPVPCTSPSPSLPCHNRCVHGEVFCVFAFIRISYSYIYISQ